MSFRNRRAKVVLRSIIIVFLLSSLFIYNKIQMRHARDSIEEICRYAVDGVSIQKIEYRAHQLSIDIYIKNEDRKVKIMAHKDVGHAHWACTMEFYNGALLSKEMFFGD